MSRPTLHKNIDIQEGLIFKAHDAFDTQVTQNTHEKRR